MDRQAIILYLQNVRDMEVVCYEIKKQWELKIGSVNSFINSHPTVANKQTHFKTSLMVTILKVLLGIICLSPAVIFVCSLIYLGPLKGDNDWLYLVPIPSGVLGFFGLFIGFSTINEAIHNYKWATKRNKEIDNENAAAIEKCERNKPIVEEKKKELKTINSFYSSQYDKARSILYDFYNMNIVPVQFRKFSAINYIYDYMNTSGESFRDALFSQQMEEGIRRIESKLDEIIDSIQMIILQQRVIYDSNRDDINRIQDQNNKMIDSLKKIENDQKNIQEYTRLSANYNRAQAFISMARYLRQ